MYFVFQGSFYFSWIFPFPISANPGCNGMSSGTRCEIPYVLFGGDGACTRYRLENI